MATEAIQLLLDFGFNRLNLNRIQAGVIEGNVGSIKVLKKVGMIQEATLRKKIILENEKKDHYIFGILKEEFNPN